MKQIPIAALVVMLSACEPTSLISFFPPTTAASFIVATGSDGRVPSKAVVVDAQTPPSIPFREMSPPERIEVLAYKEALDPLELPVGEILKPGADEPSRTLPIWDGAWSMMLEGTEPTWEETKKPLLGSFLRSACGRVEWIVEQFDEGGRDTFGIKLDEKTALIGSNTNRLYFIDVDVDTPALKIRPARTSTVLEPSALWTNGHGKVWIGTRIGQLHRASWNESALRIEKTWTTTAVADREHMLFMGGAVRPTLEILIVTILGKLLIFDGARFKPLLPIADYKDLPFGGVLWVGPHEYFVGITGERHPVHVVGDAWTREPLDDTDGIVGVGTWRGAPAVIVRRDEDETVPTSAVYARTTSGSWLQELVHRSSRLALTLGDAGDTQTVGGEGGFVRSHTDAGLCGIDVAPSEALSVGNIRALLPFGDDLLAVADSSRDESLPTTVSLIRRRFR